MPEPLSDARAPQGTPCPGIDCESHYDPVPIQHCRDCGGAPQGLTVEEDRLVSSLRQQFHAAACAAICYWIARPHLGWWGGAPPKERESFALVAIIDRLTGTPSKEAPRE